MIHKIMVQMGRTVNNASKTQLAMLAPMLVDPSGDGSVGQLGTAHVLVGGSFSSAGDVEIPERVAC